MQAKTFRWTADDQGEWLCINTTGVRPFLATLEPGKIYDVEIKPHRERRSLDANAYAWTLIGKLSAKLGIPPNEVYREQIPFIGGNYEVFPVREDRVAAWDKIWCSGHVGRMTDDLGPCKTPGYRNIRTYFGSSDYDTKQMSRLIDLIVQECKAQGIETLTPDKLAAMKEAWK